MQICRIIREEDNGAFPATTELRVQRHQRYKLSPKTNIFDRPDDIQ